MGKRHIQEVKGQRFKGKEITKVKEEASEEEKKKIPEAFHSVVLDDFTLIFLFVIYVVGYRKTTIRNIIYLRSHSAHFCFSCQLMFVYALIAGISVCVCVFFFSWIFQGLYDSFPSLPSLDALTLAHRRACRVVTVGSNLPHRGCKGSKWSRKAFRGKRQLWKSRLCVSSRARFNVWTFICAQVPSFTLFVSNLWRGKIFTVLRLC